MKSDIIWWKLVRKSDHTTSCLSGTIHRLWWEGLSIGNYYLLGYSRDCSGWKVQKYVFLSGKETIICGQSRCEVRVQRVGEPWLELID